MAKILFSAGGTEQETSLKPTSTLSPTVKPFNQEDLYTVHEIPLTVLAPPNGTTVFEPFVTVKGYTTPFSQIQINEASSASDIEGNFAVPILLGSGRNPVIITAIDGVGKRSVMEISVIFDDSQIAVFPSPLASGSADPYSGSNAY